MDDLNTIKSCDDSDIFELQKRMYEKSAIVELLSNKKIPKVKWQDCDIEEFLRLMINLDSNNVLSIEYHSCIIDRRYFGARHKFFDYGSKSGLESAAHGSKQIYQLTNAMVLDILRTYGAPSTKACIITPMATGMSLFLCLSMLRIKRRFAKYVIWSRIDQKSCFKCILTAGLKPVIVDCKIEGEKLVTNLDGIVKKVYDIGARNIVAILTTTSCFAPRAPDDIEAIGNICLTNDIPHLINNAYGIQCPAYLELIEKASKSRVDFYVSSTDKNFMVPVGGGVIASFNENLVEHISRRMLRPVSQVPVQDVFITLLSLGESGYAKLMEDREEMWKYMNLRLSELAIKFGEKILSCPENKVSIGFSLNQFQGLQPKVISEIGSMLFKRCVSGARVVQPGDTKTIAGYKFKNWGAHSNLYDGIYLNSAATVGILQRDISLFAQRLEDVLSKMQQTLINM